MLLRTALLIIPPPEVQAFAAPLRQKYAPDISMQGPSHITLFFPFVPPDEVPAASNLLRTLCNGVAPFQLKLDHYSQFEGTRYLAPSNPEPILSLHKLLLTNFPDYLPYEGQHGTELVPHLTLAHNENPKEVMQVVLPPAPSLIFTVHQLHLYLGPSEGNIPWIPVAIIPLGEKV
jgi:2'-5' RNA ligase